MAMSDPPAQGAGTPGHPGQVVAKIATHLPRPGQRQAGRRRAGVGVFGLQSRGVSQISCQAGAVTVPP